MRSKVWVGIALSCLLSVAWPGAGQGFSDEAVVLEWQEQAHNASGDLLFGRRLWSWRTGSYRDVYRNNRGDEIGCAQLAEWGITPKEWSDHAVSVWPAPGHKPRAQRSERKDAYTPQTVPTTLETILPPPDPIDIQRIMNADSCKGGQVVGLVRDFDEVVRSKGRTKTDWTAFAWRFTSEEAYAVRLRFSALDIPPGGALRVFNTDYPAECFSVDPRAGGWSPSLLSDSVTLLYEGPADAGVEVDAVGHVFVPLEEWAVSKAPAGTCNLDITCYPEWVETGSAVGALAYANSNALFFCTGALITTTDASCTIPYFLTANHCIGTANAADSLEVFWNYETDVCDGAPPPVWRLARTVGGADLLATSRARNGTDFALLRLRESPPSELVRLGWTSVPPTPGTETTCIHHPRGDFRRISFATVVDDPVEEHFASAITAPNYHQVVYYAGTTEGGSSGAPLFLSESGQVVGQLWGGAASCDRPDDPDFFGRFDLTYAMVQRWLDPTDLAGDLDRSGRVDLTDLEYAIDGAIGIAIPFNADVNDSGSADASDIQFVLNHLGSTAE